MPITLCRKQDNATCCVLIAICFCLFLSFSSSVGGARFLFEMTKMPSAVLLEFSYFSFGTNGIIGGRLRLRNRRRARLWLALTIAIFVSRPAQKFDYEWKPGFSSSNYTRLRVHHTHAHKKNDLSCATMIQTMFARGFLVYLNFFNKKKLTNKNHEIFFYFKIDFYTPCRI